MRTLLLLIAAARSALCFVPVLRSNRVTTQINKFSPPKSDSKYKSDNDYYDSNPKFNESEAFRSAEQSLVAACEFSETYGPDREIRTLDGERIMYRNGLLHKEEWFPHHGRPIPFSFSTQVPLTDIGPDDLVIDTKGFTWRTEDVLIRQGLVRYDMVDNADLVQNEQNYSVPVPWYGPINIPPEIREIGHRRLHDETLSLGWLLDDERWLTHYSKLADFSARFGHSNVPENWINDIPLSRWVIQQRLYYRKYARNNYYQYQINEDGSLGPKLTELTPWRIQMLYDLGFSFKIILTWTDRYRQLKRYYELNGNVDIPPYTMYEDEVGEGEFPGLYLWVQHQRTEYRSLLEGMASTMTDKRFMLLDALGVNWNPLERAWEGRLEQLKAFRRVHSHVRVRRSDDHKLYFWLKDQRQQYKLYKKFNWESRLTPERIRQLNELGMDWDPLATKWQYYFDKLVEFAYKFGHCQVPVEYKEDPQLSLWARKQRRAKRRGVMSREREAKLMSLGFVFRTYDELFERGFKKLEIYWNKHKSTVVPLSYHDRELVSFIVTQRSAYRDKQNDKVSSLTEERQERLEQLGFVWKVDVNIDAWDCALAKLKVFSMEYGHVDVPTDYVDITLYNFVNNQRYEYKKLNDGKSSSLTPKRIAQLEAMGFVWNTNDARWVQRFKELQDFKEVYGHCNVPTQYDVNQPLATWVRCQREQYNKLQSGKSKLMTDARIKLLESVGFEWSIRKKQKAK